MRCDHDEAIEVMHVPRKHVVQTGGHQSQRRSRSETKQDHAGMGPKLNEDQLSKITVVGNRDPPFSMGDGEELWIR